MEFNRDQAMKKKAEIAYKIHSQLPKGEKSRIDVQGKKEDALIKRDGAITKVVDSSSHLPQSSPADFNSVNTNYKNRHIKSEGTKEDLTKA